MQKAFLFLPFEHLLSYATFKVHLPWLLKCCIYITASLTVIFIVEIDMKVPYNSILMLFYFASFEMNW